MPLLQKTAINAALVFNDNRYLRKGSAASQTVTGAVTVSALTVDSLSGILIGTAGLVSAVSVLDTASVDLTLSGTQLSATVLPAGVDHNSLNNYAANRHFLQTDITNISTALTTGLVKVTTGTGALTIVTDNSSNWNTAYGWGDHGAEGYIRSDGTVAMAAALNMDSHKITNVTDPTTNQDAATKAYVDLAASSIHLAEYFSDTADALGGIYYVMQETTAGAGTVTSANVTANDQSLLKWITPIGKPHLDRILAGNYDLHAHLLKTGTRTITCYCKFYYVDADGTSNLTLLGTSPVTAAITTSDLFYDIYINIATEVSIATDKRLIVELLCGTVSAGADTTITMTVGGTADPHISIDIAAVDLNTIFVPYTGATADVNLGTHSLGIGAAPTLGIIHVTGTSPILTIEDTAGGSTTAIHLRSQSYDCWMRNNTATGLSISTESKTDALVISHAGDVTIAESTITKNLSGNGVQTVGVGIMPTGDIATDAGFDNAGAWGTTGTATIAGSQANCPSDTARAQNGVITDVAITTEIGITYSLSFTVAGNAGAVTVSGSATLLDDDYAVGAHTVTFVADSTSVLVRFANSTTSGANAEFTIWGLESVNTSFSPTHLAVELTNDEEYTTPLITISSGSLATNSIIIVSNITDTYPIIINSSGTQVSLDVTRCIAYIKSSIGWIPLLGIDAAA